MDIVDLGNIPTQTLFNELRNRGYKTDLVFGLNDVDYQLEQINADREEEDHIKLDEFEKSNVLDDVFNNTDYYCERINSDIEDKILEYDG